MSKNEKGFENIVLTGDRPTGPLHLGHYVGSMQNRVKLQDEYDTCFYMVADIQALTDNADNPQKVRDNVLEVALDNLAVGVDPSKTIMFIQSMIPEIAELTVLFMNLVTLQQLTQNPTIKTEAAQKGFNLTSKLSNLSAEDAIDMAMERVEEDDYLKLRKGIKPEGGNVSVPQNNYVPLGFLAYPVSQTADILFCKANVIPVGEDQLPVLEQGNKILRKFNALYGEVFPEIKGMVGDHGRLVGIDGNAKASKSLGNAIMLSDSNEEIERKVMSMYTDSNHLRVEDPGKVEGNVVFNYLDIFDSNTEEVAELKSQYEQGGLGDVVLKKRLVTVLQNFLEPIRARRAQYAQNPEMVMKILLDGTERAREFAKKTMDEVREVMKINYVS